MATKEMLVEWVLEALNELGGSAAVLDVSKKIWINHETELRQAGNLFFTWQYDMRWAAHYLRKQKKLHPAETSPRGIWEVVA